MSRMTGFMFQDEYLERLAKLSDQELGRLVRALSIYHSTGEAQELAGRESIAFDFIKVDIDRIESSYSHKCEKLKENFKSGANGSQMDSKMDANAESDNANGHKDKVKDKEREIKETPSKEGVKKAASRFTPPTVDQVRDYCQARGNKINAEAFVDFYASNGWKVGSNVMKDWQAAVRTWERRDQYSVHQGGGAKAQEPKKVHAQDYTQRVYKASDLSAATEALLLEAMEDD